jgi:hypothetical protein
MCENCEDFQPYFELTGLDLSAINLKGDKIHTLSKDDTLCLKLDFKGVFTAANQPQPISAFLPAAYAKCPPNGNNGFKHTIEAIDIYSKDGYFTASSSMEKLTDIALFSDPYYDTHIKYTAKEFISYFQKRNNYFVQRGMRIFITQPSSVSNQHNFIIEIRKSDGSIVRGETEKISWR